jgi:glycerol kinase
MIDNWEDVRQAHETDDLAFGTVESWIAYVSLTLLFNNPTIDSPDRTYSAA